MSDHLIMCGDRLVTPPTFNTLAPGVVIPLGEGALFHTFRVPMNYDEWSEDDLDLSDEEKAFGEKTECRVCHEDDFIVKMEAPCACRGTIKFAHRKCIQQWCDEKEHIICEICNKAYRPDYTVTPISSEANVSRSEETVVDISPCPGTPHEYDSPHLPGEHSEHLIDAEFDKLDEGNSCGDSSCSVICRNVIIVVELILSCCNAVFLTILLLKEAYNPSKTDDDEEFYTTFYIVLGFFLPCFVTAFALNYWQSSDKKHEPRELATAEVEIVIHAEEHNGEQRLQIASDPHECTCHLEA